MQPNSPATAAASDETSPAQPSFVLPVRVYYEDTDAAGVVYYANYLRFCERARTEWLRALGFEQQAMMTSAGTGFVVRSVQADYLAPARLDDALEVVTRIATLRRASLLFDQAIRRQGQRAARCHHYPCVEDRSVSHRRQFLEKPRRTDLAQQGADQ